MLGDAFSDKLAHLLRLCGVEEVDTSYWIPHDEQRREAVQAIWPARYRHVVAFNPYGAGRARRLSEESICKVLSLIEPEGIGMVSAYCTRLQKGKKWRG